MEIVQVFVLIETHSIRGKNDVRRNADVTFDLAEAEIYAEQTPIQTDEGYIEYSFDRFEKPTELVIATAETTMFLTEMRQLRENVKPIQELIIDMTLMQAAEEADGL